MELIIAKHPVSIISAIFKRHIDTVISQLVIESTKINKAYTSRTRNFWVGTL